MANPLRALILEDNPADVKLVLDELFREGLNLDWRWVENEKDYLGHLEPTLDVVLADYHLPDFGAPQALQLLRERYPEIPFIVISGAISEEVAVECLKQGATDYLAKDRLGRLGRAITQAIEQKRLGRERQKAEEALRESEERYRGLFNNVPIGLYRTTPDGRFLEANPAHVQMLGFPDRESLLKVNAVSFYVDPEQRREWQRLLEEKGMVQHFQKQLRRYGGSIIWVEENARIVRDSEGRVLYYEGSFQDITERKRAEENLRESEGRFQGLFDHAPMGYCEYDIQGRINRVNHTELEMLGYAPEEMIGQPVWDFVVEKERVRQQILERLAGKRSPARNLEGAYRRKDGTAFPVLIEDRLLRNQEGEITGSRVTIQDITKLKQAEEEFKLAHHQLLKIIEFLPDATFVVDSDQKVIAWNKAIEEMTGIKKEEIMGKGDYEYALPFYGKRRPMLIDLLFSEDREGEKSFPNIKKKDGKIYAEAFIPSLLSRREVFLWKVASPLRDGDGRRTGAIQSLRDITDQKKTYIQLLQSEKMASIGQLAAGVAHEINNPIGFVSSNLNTMADFLKDLQSLLPHYQNLVKSLKEEEGKGNLPSPIVTKTDLVQMAEKEVDIGYILEEIPKLIKESREGTERVKTIVQDMKNFAHPGDQQLKPADLNTNLESTLSVVWNELKYKATVERDYGDIPGVQCYPQQLNQVFINLLVNAAQAIKEKGKIRISTLARKGFVEVRISDTGVGIPPENLPRIFNPFFTTKEVGKGTGLGLHIVYNIIKKHGGSISVRSKVGEGSVFILRIPLKASPRPSENGES